MAFPESLDPAVPPNTGESPRLGAQRIREVKQFILDVFGIAASPSQQTAPSMSMATDGTTTLKGMTAQVLTNRTGAGVAAGDVVTLATGSDTSIVLGDTVSSMRPLVVAAETIANLATGRFYTGIGVCPVAVKVQGAVTRGNYLRKSATTLALEDAGILITAGASPPLGAVAVALTAAAGPGAGTVTAMWLGTQGAYPGSLLRFTAFTANGTWNKGQRTRFVYVVVIGGGGAGGGVSDTAAGAAHGGGGGGGGCAGKLIDVTAIASSTITVGAAAAGGTGLGPTGANNSWADGTNTLTGNGGVGGTQMAHTAGNLVANSGAGGTATGGDINLNGGDGGNGAVVGGFPIGSGFGGAAPPPFGGQIRRPPSLTGAGNAGYAAGGGGSGAVDTAAATKNGGNGAIGAVYVWEYA